MTDWVAKLAQMALAACEQADATQDSESHTVEMPTPEPSPLANLMSLPPWEISEWMGRSQYKMLH